MELIAYWNFVLSILFIFPYVFTDNSCILHADSFESQFCDLKDEITAMSAKYSDLTQAQKDIANLKHTVQSQTARILDNGNAIASYQNSKNLTDQVGQLQKMVTDLLNRTAEIEAKVTGPVKACDSSPCYNNASCLELTGGYYCACQGNFTGRHCEQEDHCAISPCQHGGTCYSNAISYICNCTVDYGGPTCSNKLNPCDTNPCLNGLCTPLNDTFHCSCDAGFSGVNCNTSLVTSSPVVPSSTSGAIVTSAAINTTEPPTTLPSVCDGQPKCNPPATCVPSPNSNDFKCECPQTPETLADACWEPSYLEPFGFCCRVNICVIPKPDPEC
ncbi:fibropellin-1-like [Mizuhopecten yessoensis]|uniref:Fibropellin-1 n=1 Tax=Mizuhopecten yessoensis TaxID=6573 RepID=A0A210QRU6_MIZYE|nr:fibropellin-1-like [Mizuhopecten yessoensis]OWF51462.1 Fibropellin-1 [Mizuhopecten yessoensis]